jgi:hypothetical protein
VAAARFELYVLSRRRGGAPPAAGPGVTWRLLSSNNRDLGRAPGTFPDVESCVRMLRNLQGALAGAVAVISRDGRARWTWRLRLNVGDDAVDVAVSSRAYQRRVQSEYACAAFRSLAPGAEVIATPRVVEF